MKPAATTGCDDPVGRFAESLLFIHILYERCYLWQQRYYGDCGATRSLLFFRVYF